MRRGLRIALSSLLAATGLVLAGPSVTASAQTSGPETFEGFLVATGVSYRFTGARSVSMDLRIQADAVEVTGRMPSVSSPK